MWQWKNHGPGLSVKNRIVTSEQDAVDATGVRLPYFGHSTVCGHRDTHGSSSSTAWNDELDALVRSKTIDTTCGKEVRCILGTTQDLE